jgi:hypothetical protein
MAQAWLEADYRANAYIGWFEAHDQPGLNVHLRDRGFLSGAVARVPQLASARQPETAGSTREIAE